MKIDYDNIADGLFDMMPKDDQAVLAFGMIPKTWLDLAGKQFKKKIENDGAILQEMLDKIVPITGNELGEAVISLCAEFEKGLSLALYRVASKKGIMVV